MFQCPQTLIYPRLQYILIPSLCIHLENTTPNYILQISEVPSLLVLQKITLIGTTHILKKVLSIQFFDVFHTKYI